MSEDEPQDSARDRAEEALQLERLLADAVRGDADAWRAIVARFAPRVHGLIVAQCRNDDLAEEITQSAFCTVAAKLAGYVESGRFEAWLFRIAMNRLLDEMRRRSRHARPIDYEPLRSVPDQRARGVTAAEVEIHERLRMALETLSEGDREIIEMRHTGGMSFKALSDYFDEPLGTLLARHHRALRKLRTALEKLGVDGPDADGGGRHASGGAS